jgi:uncharacterized phage-associated protein
METAHQINESGEKKMAYSAAAIANYIIERMEVTNCRLQKILYFAHATYYRKYDELLFTDAIEAWPYGPVIPKVYFKLKKYGMKMIKDIIMEDDGIHYKVIQNKDYQVIDHLNEILRIFRNIPTEKIVLLSCQEDGAWAKTLRYKGIDPNDEDLFYKIPRHLTILDEDIKICGR